MGNYAIPGMDDDDSSGSGWDTSNWGAYGSGIGGALGIAGGVYSAITGSQDAKKVADLQKQQAAREQQENDLRRDAMRMNSDRTQMQTLREAQFSGALARTQATSSGSQFSSGLGGAMGTIGGLYATKAGNQSEALQFGLQKSQLVDQIDLLKMQEADAKAKMSADSAFGGMLGGIGKNLGSIGNLAGLLLA